MAIALALAAAFGYGVGDFLGGMLSRRMHFAVVSVVSGVAAPAITMLAIVLASPVSPSPQALMWGAASGLGTAFGTLALFRGLGRGRIGIVAPLSALAAAAIPVLFGVAVGDRPTVVAWVGVALAMPAIWLVASPGRQEASDGSQSSTIGSSVTDGLLAGGGFSILFIGLKLAGDGSGLWPVMANELVAALVFVAFLVGTIRTVSRRRPTARDVALAIVVGIIGAGASVAYFLATHSGLLAVVVVLTSLYPAVTVALAVLFAHEPIIRRQLLGLILAGVAIAMIALG